jgi:hypothetical protein
MRFIFVLVLTLASLIILSALRRWLSEAPAPLGRYYPPLGMGGLRL